MTDCGHCKAGIMGAPESLDPKDQSYWHCDCWGHGGNGTNDCCRCGLVADENCNCDACIERKKAAA